MYGQIKWNPQASTTVQPTEGPDWKSEEIGCSGQTGRMRKPDFEKCGLEELELWWKPAAFTFRVIFM